MRIISKVLIHVQVKQFNTLLIFYFCYCTHTTLITGAAAQAKEEEKCKNDIGNDGELDYWMNE